MNSREILNLVGKLTKKAMALYKGQRNIKNKNLIWYLYPEGKQNISSRLSSWIELKINSFKQEFSKFNNGVPADMVFAFVCSETMYSDAAISAVVNSVPELEDTANFAKNYGITLPANSEGSDKNIGSSWWLDENGYAFVSIPELAKYETPKSIKRRYVKQYTSWSIPSAEDQRLSGIFVGSLTIAPTKNGGSGLFIQNIEGERIPLYSSESSGLEYIRKIIPNVTINATPFHLSESGKLTSLYMQRGVEHSDQKLMMLNDKENIYKLNINDTSGEVYLYSTSDPNKQHVKLSLSQLGSIVSRDIIGKNYSVSYTHRNIKALTEEGKNIVRTSDKFYSIMRLIELRNFLENYGTINKDDTPSEMDRAILITPEFANPEVIAPGVAVSKRDMLTHKTSLDPIDPLALRGHNWVVIMQEDAIRHRLRGHANLAPAMNAKKGGSKNESRFKTPQEAVRFVETMLVNKENNSSNLPQLIQSLLPSMERADAILKSTFDKHQKDMSNIYKPQNILTTEKPIKEIQQDLPKKEKPRFRLDLNNPGKLIPKEDINKISSNFLRSVAKKIK